MGEAQLLTPQELDAAPVAAALPLQPSQERTQIAEVVGRAEPITDVQRVAATYGGHRSAYDEVQRIGRQLRG